MATYFEVSCTSVLYQIKDDYEEEDNDTSDGSRRNHRKNEWNDAKEQNMM